MEVEGPHRTRMDPRESRRNLAAFWMLGLFNNTSYVVMLAGATEISSGAAGLTFLAAVVPSLLCKASLPYWADAVGYTTRVWLAAGLMVAAFNTVASTHSRPWQLLGVACASLQGGLGEFSCLALTSLSSNSRAAITMWSSGTGFAGVAGYAWVALLHVVGGLSFPTTLRLASTLAAAWLATFHILLDRQQLRPAAMWRHDSDSFGEARAGAAAGGDDDTASEVHAGFGGGGGGDGAGGGSVQAWAAEGSSTGGAEERQRLLLATAADSTGGGGPWGGQAATGHGGSSAWDSGQHGWEQDGKAAAAAAELWHVEEGAMPKGSQARQRMSWRERLQRTAALWPYMVPLCTVYFAEYAMQSGAWTAIGFPLEDPAARKHFYVYSNWCYQAGVFLSRSSGLLWQPTRGTLWAMPLQQLGWLAFFILDALYRLWYNWGLLVPCFITGLLGGAVYVSAFSLISREVDPAYVEFSLGAASLADSLGVALADVAGILIQGCLWKANGLEGADFKC